MSLAGLTIIPVGCLGWQNHLPWALQISPALACGIKTAGNRSLAGFVLALADPRNLSTYMPVSRTLCTVSKFSSGICYGAFLIWYWRWRKDAQGLTVDLTLLPLVALMVSPLSWPQYWVLAMLPLAYLWARARDPAARCSG